MRIFVLAGISAASILAGDATGQKPKELLVINAHEDTVRCVAFSPDGKLLATGGYDSLVRLWDLPSGRERAAYKGHEGNMLSVAFSPDDETLASGGMDSARLWNRATGHEKLKLKGSAVLSVAFSPDGEVIAIGGQNGGNVILYDVATGEEVAVLEGQPGDDVVFSVAFSPDGKLLASARQDMETTYTLPDGAGIETGNGTTITLWDMNDRGKPTVVRHVEKIVGSVWAVAFSPDGKTLAAATEDMEVRL